MQSDGGTVQSASWPAVTTILHSLVTGFQSEGWVGIFGSSLYRMTCGFLLAAVLGIAAGLAMGASAFMHRLLMPTFEIFRVLPIPAVVPPLIFWRHNRARNRLESGS